MYAEIAFACDTIETVDVLLPSHLDTYRPIPREASFLATGAGSPDQPRQAAATSNPSRACN